MIELPLPEWAMILLGIGVWVLGVYIFGELFNDFKKNH
jgi:hypothetical protein